MVSGNSKKNNFREKLIIILILIVVFLTILSSIFYMYFIRNMTYENAYANITELSAQTKTQLELNIDNQKKFVNMMVDFIDKGYAKSIEDIFERFNPDLASYHFTRLVVLDKNGNGITSDGFKVKDYPDILEFFNRKDVYLSENRPSTVSDYQVNIYSKTFEFNGEELVLFATINTENYKEILSRRLFGGKGGTYLINNKGLVLIDSYDSIHENDVNLFDYIREIYELKGKKNTSLVEMQEKIAKDKNGTFDINFKGSTVFVHYERLNVNDWYVVTVATDRTIAKKLGLLLGISLLLCFLLNFTVIGVLIYIYFSSQNKSRKLYEAAYVDPITGLKNELYFRENADELLKSSGCKYLVVVDIDNFKKYNKMYDYVFCNNILKVFGQRLQEVLPENNITCRTSRDMFVCIFNYSKNIDDLLNKINVKLERLLVDERELTIDVSMGVYKTSSSDDINKALEKASVAHAKIKGIYNEKYYIFDSRLEEKMLEEQKIEALMEEALRKGEFKVIYQPKISTSSEKLVGAEALVRWYHENDVIAPSKFIPIFEKNKFILKLDLYIFEEVCKDLINFQNKYGVIPKISVNVSKENFVHENFIDSYVEIMKKYDLKPENIELEITESAIVDEDINIKKILSKIKRKGFIIAIDDFGTGTSSLSMLQNIPIDIIKIDKAFIDNANLESNENLINYIEFIAKKLGIKTIVEGVETEKQVDFIRKLKCDMIQGYYYSKPISKDDFGKKFLEKEI